MGVASGLEYADADGAVNGPSVYTLRLDETDDDSYSLIFAWDTVRADKLLMGIGTRRLEELPAIPQVAENSLLPALPSPGNSPLQTGLLLAGAVLGGYLLNQCLRRYRKPRRDSSGFPAGFAYRLPEP